MSDKQREIDNLAAKIEIDGFGYAISEYGSKLARIDPEFNDLRKTYLEIENQIRDYLNIHE